MLLLHFLHFNVFVLLVWLSKVEKGGKEKVFFSATTHTPTNAKVRLETEKNHQTHKTRNI